MFNFYSCIKCKISLWSNSVDEELGEGFTPEKYEGKSSAWWWWWPSSSCPLVLLVLYGREKKEEIEVGVGNLKGCLKGYIDGYSKGYCKSYFKQYLKINWHILKTKAKIDFIHFLCKFYFISFLYEHLSFLTC